MTQSSQPVAAREHRASKRYIYAFGGGRAEGDATMRDQLGGKGAIQEKLRDLFKR